MPKYENKCPVHNEIDVYTQCSFNCIYCISQTKELNSSIDIVQEIEKIKSLNSNSNPFYLSPWTDCYDYEEKEKGFTKRILTALSDKKIPFFVITKSPLVLRDIDLFKNKENTFIAVSINSLNDELTKQLEPNAPTATERKELIEKLVKIEGLKTVVKIDPIIPGLTDSNNLENLIDWLCECKPGAITAETLRISMKILDNMKKHLPASMIEDMMQYYPDLSDVPTHPYIDYRLKVLKQTSERFQKAEIKASFCKASLPERITEFDCRGGYEYDY